MVSAAAIKSSGRTIFVIFSPGLVLEELLVDYYVEVRYAIIDSIMNLHWKHSQTVFAVDGNGNMQTVLHTTLYGTLCDALYCRWSGIMTVALVSSMLCRFVFVGAEHCF